MLSSSPSSCLRAASAPRLVRASAFSASDSSLLKPPVRNASSSSRHAFISSEETADASSNSRHAFLSSEKTTTVSAPACEGATSSSSRHAFLSSEGTEASSSSRHAFISSFEEMGAFFRFSRPAFSLETGEETCGGVLSWEGGESPSGGESSSDGECCRGRGESPVHAEASHAERL